MDGNRYDRRSARAGTASRGPSHRGLSGPPTARTALPPAVPVAAALRPPLQTRPRPARLCRRFLSPRSPSGRRPRARFRQGPPLPSGALPSRPRDPAPRQPRPRPRPRVGEERGGSGRVKRQGPEGEEREGGGEGRPGRAEERSGGGGGGGRRRGGGEETAEDGEEEDEGGEEDEEEEDEDEGPALKRRMKRVPRGRRQKTGRRHEPPASGLGMEGGRSGPGGGGGERRGQPLFTWLPALGPAPELPPSLPPAFSCRTCILTATFHLLTCSI
ncbi:hypothetical protein AB1E18_013708 [Capra hircus]